MNEENLNLEERLLKKKQVAEMLACSPRTVDRLAALGRLTRVLVLGGVRFRRSEVLAIVNGAGYD
jgi:predicted DNA-binding transcriptional regulator AlpA